MTENKCGENKRNTEFSPGALITLHPDKTYINVCKVANFMSSNKDFYDKNTQLRLKTIPRKNICVNVDLNIDTYLNMASLTLTPYDMAVIDAVHTLYFSGLDTFSTGMILRTMSGNMDQDATKQKVESISQSINKMRHIDISIEYTEEAKVRKLIPQNGTAVIKSYLLPVEDIICHAPNGRAIHAYRILKSSALYDYAVQIHQIICVPSTILDTHDSSLNDTDEVIILKRYLIKRIEGMKNPKNNLDSKEIIYSWYSAKTHSSKGLLYELGITAENYSDSAWLNKKSKLHQTVKKILDCFKSKGYIYSYTEIRGAKSCIKGVSLCVTQPKGDD